MYRDDLLDYENEAWLADLYEENAEQALADFKVERLASYYHAHPYIAQPAFTTLVEACRLLAISPTASLVLASTAAEVGLKTVILRPLVVGVVHSEALAAHVADVVLASKHDERFKQLVFHLLREVAGVDLATYRRPTSHVSLWQETKRNEEVRNQVVHRAAVATALQASGAVDIASGILDGVLPLVLGRLRLHLHDDHHVCGELHLSSDLIAP